MFKGMFNPFGKDAVNQKRVKFLHDASIASVEHQAAAEHHMALATMYKVRVARLQQELEADSVVEFPPLKSVQLAA